MQLCPIILLRIAFGRVLYFGPQHADLSKSQRLVHTQVVMVQGVGRQ